MNAQERVKEVKGLVFDIKPRAEKRKAEQFIESELTPCVGLSIPYVHRMLYRLCDEFERNNAIKEQIKNIADIPEEPKKPEKPEKPENSEKKDGKFKRFFNLIPWKEVAAFALNWLISLKAK